MAVPKRSESEPSRRESFLPKTNAYRSVLLATGTLFLLGCRAIALGKPPPGPQGCVINVLFNTPEYQVLWHGGGRALLATHAPKKLYIVLSSSPDHLGPAIDEGRSSCFWLSLFLEFYDCPTTNSSSSNIN